MPVAPPVTPPEKPFRKGVGASGLIEARAENTSIGVPAAGLVTAVHVKVWDEVKPGQPLFELDKRELEAKLPTEKAQIAVAEATVKRAQDQVERFERLAAADSGALAADELSTRRNDAAVAARPGCRPATRRWPDGCRASSSCPRPVASCGPPRVAARESRRLHALLQSSTILPT